MKQSVITAMINVTCAIIRNDEGRVLAVRRGPGMENAGKWEFPGGKVMEGENEEDCIIREINEELGIGIIIIGSLASVEHEYSDKTIKLIPFICDTLASKPQLTEHDDHRWVIPDRLLTLDLTAADIPVAEEYILQCKSPVSGLAGSAISSEVPVGAVDSGPVDMTGQSPESDNEENSAEMAKVVSRIKSTTEISMVARSAVTDTLLLTQLVSLSSSHEPRVGFMASWALSKVADIDIEVLVPFLPGLVESLPDVPNESVQRSFMRIITKSDVRKIPASHHVMLIDYCMNIMQTEQQAVAPKAYSMEILANLAVLYPDMANEVAAAVQLAITEGSAGMKAQGRKVIAKLISLRSS